MSLLLPTRRRRALRLAMLSASLIGYVAGAAALLDRTGILADSEPTGCVAKDAWFYCDGERFVVKGVGWDPTRPGEKPWDDVRTLDLVRSDLARIRAAGFNTLRTWEALTPDELAIAEAENLRVLQGIWIDPGGDFSNARFREQQLAKVRHVVGYSSKSTAVLGYLVMNEPEPAHLLEVGIATSRQFLRDVVETAHEVDTAALVSFASWPGLEFFDVPEMDFVAVNLYPVRPKALLDAVGYDGLVRVWKESQAARRPLVISEYGVSVAPIDRRSNRAGGWSEQEQAALLPELADSAMRNRSAGGVAFMWIDGWWKNDDGANDEKTHDPLDAEEWFGLHAMESPDARDGRPRPALAAMQRWNRAVMTEPTNGSRSEDGVAIEIFAEEEPPHPSLYVSIDGGREEQVEIRQRGSWIRGRLALAPASRSLKFSLRSDGESLGEWQRTLRSTATTLKLSLEIQKAGENTFAIATVATGGGQLAAGVPVHIAISEPKHKIDRFETVTTDAFGIARLPIELPPGGRLGLAVAALRADSTSPPSALRAVVVDGDSSK